MVSTIPPSPPPFSLSPSLSRGRALHVSVCTLALTLYIALTLALDIALAFTLALTLALAFALVCL